MDITLHNLPKISLNKWYAGMHWTKRKKIKDDYTQIVRSQFSNTLTRENTYKVEYHFTFKSRPLDASNCVAMVKMIEDIIFETDSYKVVTELVITSSKGLEDKVLIKVENSLLYNSPLFIQNIKTKSI
tara:strand:+ start:109 stop:492 length:384 start_codon:yes stop_codon:yes gene_type:complete